MLASQRAAPGAKRGAAASSVYAAWAPPAAEATGQGSRSFPPGDTPRRRVRGRDAAGPLGPRRPAKTASPSAQPGGEGGREGHAAAGSASFSPRAPRLLPPRRVVTHVSRRQLTGTQPKRHRGPHRVGRAVGCGGGGGLCQAAWRSLARRRPVPPTVLMAVAAVAAGWGGVGGGRGGKQPAVGRGRGRGHGECGAEGGGTQRACVSGRQEIRVRRGSLARARADAGRRGTQP
jgi:hypothetical protein